MAKQKRPTVIILEADDTIRDAIEKTLTQQQWDVIPQNVSKDALDTLKTFTKTPCALFISDYKLPKMQGDDILRKVREISPLTQRMLIVPTDQLQMLISAVQKAKIHACITSPFNDKDLLRQAGTCLKHFKRAGKRERFKRVTMHQNQQMLTIAQRLMKKENRYKKAIEKKKREIIRLKSKKRELKQAHDQKTKLIRILEKKAVLPSPETFKTEFLNSCNLMKQYFDTVTGRHDAAPVKFDLSLLSSESPAKAADDSDEKPKESELAAPAAQIIQSVLIQSKDKTAPVSKPHPKEANPDGGTAAADDASPDTFKLTLSENRIKAYIHWTGQSKPATEQTGLNDILNQLKENNISYGIVEDITITSWIENGCKEKLLVAKGEAPEPGRKGKITYHFETEYTNPGKINEDGSIDFTQRGEIPFVSKEDALAVKTPARESRPGVDVSGNPVEVEEITDPVFTAGDGAKLSEDELTITAAIDGQPNLDAMGNITVNPELSIPGDVDFETGNIEFKGNIVVKGTVKEGFKVTGVNLTAKEIEGAAIDLTGDLNICAGITDATISTHGNIYAKFINHSSITSFGNLEISKEVIDSNILLSGACNNPSGHIISSNIIAKMGVEAGSIGTVTARPDKLTVGLDKHIETLTTQIQESIDTLVSENDSLKEKVGKLEEQDQELYQQVSEKAHIQDRAQVAIKEVKDNGSADAASQIATLEKKAAAAEKNLNAVFEQQDNIAAQIEQLNNQINRAEEKIKSLVLEKKALREFSKKETPKPVVTIAKTASQDTIIAGPNATLTLREDTSRCKIQELQVDNNGMVVCEMTVSDL